MVFMSFEPAAPEVDELLFIAAVLMGHSFGTLLRLWHALCWPEALLAALTDVNIPNELGAGFVPAYEQ
jgi:hypothetical protein